MTGTACQGFSDDSNPIDGNVQHKLTWSLEKSFIAAERSFMAFSNKHADDAFHYIAAANF